MAEEVKEQTPEEVEVKEEPAAPIVEEKKEEKTAPKDSKKKAVKSHVSDEKKQAVKELAERMKTSKTIMLVSIKSLPSAQLQKIKKDLRGKADVQVIKKSILTRAIDATGIPEIDGLKEHVEADTAVALSDDDAFEIAAFLTANRNPIAAKTGQEATDDIQVEAGPTDLMPGPDISALGNVGLQVAVEEGKIAIKAPHVVLKKGEEVTEGIASVLLKLDIKPFMIGLSPTVIYDGSAKKIYVGVKIDKDEALNNLLTAQSKGLGLAQSLKIVTKDTIGYLLAKANAEASSLEKLAPAEAEAPKEEEKKDEEKPAEEKKEEEAEKASPDVPSEDGKENIDSEEAVEETTEVEEDKGEEVVEKIKEEEKESVKDAE